MTDKEKIREEVKKLKSQLIKGACSSQIAMETMCKEEAYNEVLTILDSLQEEPVASKVLEDMLNAKTAAESLGISQEEHDRIVDELIYGKEPEYLDDFLALEEIPPKFPLISKKKCMYTKDDFTDEDRKVLCDGCEEECKYAQREEPVNKDFELALAEMIDKAQKCVVEPWVVAAQWKDELIKLAKSEEPVSEELEEAAEDYAATGEILPNGKEMISFDALKAFKAGAKWKEKQMMAKAVDATVHIEAGNYPYIPQIELYDYDKDVPLAKEGDKYKVVLIKENLLCIKGK